MNINWFTVVAQLLNFLLLVVLLKRFLYKPILNAIEERQRKIEAQLKDAESKQQDAIKEKEEFTRKNEELERGRSSMLAKFQADAESVRIKLLDQAREEIVSVKNKWKESFELEQKERTLQISNKIQDEVFLLTKKIVAELSSENLNELMVSNFLKQLESMNEVDKGKLINALVKTTQPVIVRSKEELSHAVKDKFKTVIASFGKDLPIQFEMDSSLLGGVELLITGYKISWNFRDYLSSIEADAKGRIDHFFSQEIKVQQ